MLTSNLAVDQRFANGTQGRLLFWSPSGEESKKAVPASHPDVCTCFVKEASVQKRGTLLPDLDMIDCHARQENLNVRGEPIMLQIPLVPSYALTVHKTQALSPILVCVVFVYECAYVLVRAYACACVCVCVLLSMRQSLSIRHLVLGCLEGCFAQGHVYVLASRVTDPANFALVGLPPHDILNELAVALREQGLDIDEVFQRAVTCGKEFIYDPCRRGDLRQRFAQKFNKERSVPIRWRDLDSTLNPQPVAFDVIRGVLVWIDRCDEASKEGRPKPDFCSEDGSHIFPPEGSEDELWWLTDVVKRTDATEEKGDEDGPPDSEEEEAEEEDRGQEPKAPDALTSDSDPESDQETPSSQSQTVILPVRADTKLRAPFVAWRPK